MTNYSNRWEWIHFFPLEREYLKRKDDKKMTKKNLKPIIHLFHRDHCSNQLQNGGKFEFENKDFFCLFTFFFGLCYVTLCFRFLFEQVGFMSPPPPYIQLYHHWFPFTSSFEINLQISLLYCLEQFFFVHFVMYLVRKRITNIIFKLL